MHDQTVVASGSRWREKESGATFVVVEVKDNGMLVWGRWEATGELFNTDGLNFTLWKHFTPLDRGRTW